MHRELCAANRTDSYEQTLAPSTALDLRTCTLSCFALASCKSAAQAVQGSQSGDVSDAYAVRRPAQALTALQGCAAAAAPALQPSWVPSRDQKMQQGHWLMVLMQLLPLEAAIVATGSCNVLDFAYGQERAYVKATCL